MRILRQRSFTLTELLIVMILVAVMMAFGIPFYIKTLQRSQARVAVMNLIAIHAAQKVYYANNSTYQSGADLSALNTGLRLGLTDAQSSYLGDVDTCVATSNSGAAVYQIMVIYPNSLHNGTNPVCTGTACP